MQTQLDLIERIAQQLESVRYSRNRWAFVAILGWGLVAWWCLT